MKISLKSMVTVGALSIMAACQSTGGGSTSEDTARDIRDARLVIYFLATPVDQMSEDQKRRLAQAVPKWATVFNGTFRYSLLSGRVVCPSGLVCPTIDFGEKTWTYQGAKMNLPPSVNQSSRFLTVEDMRFMYGQLTENQRSELFSAVRLFILDRANSGGSGESSGGNSGGSDSGSSGGSESGGGDDV